MSCCFVFELSKEFFSGPPFSLDGAPLPGHEHVNIISHAIKSDILTSKAIGTL